MSKEETSNNAAHTPMNRIRLPQPQRQSLPAQVATILKHYLLSERLAPGTRLPPERQLADALNVSRTVLREALHQLIGSGLIERRPLSGLCVAEFDRSRLAAELAPISRDDTKVRDLIELRVIIEIGAIETIVRRVAAEHLAEIEHWVLDGERRLAAREPLVLADVRFHAALLRVLGNHAVDALLPLIEEHLRQNFLADAHQLGGSGTPDDYRVVDEHRRIFEAVKRRDITSARLLIRAHLNDDLNRDGDTLPEQPEPATEPQTTIGGRQS